jgi:predicted RNase H-like nuclease
MANVAGVDGTPGGWAVVLSEGGRRSVRQVTALRDIVDGAGKLDTLAVDVPIGLLDAYQTGGRACDIEARKQLQKRASSVFPAPVRSVLDASSWEDACSRSRASAPHGKAISKQAFAILPKIREVDALLQSRPELRDIIREVHPELCFRELEGRPMDLSKRKRQGREHRKQALRRCFPDLDPILKAGQEREHLPIEDILDAAIACWSALRLAEGRGRSLIEPVPWDSTGLSMTIWV